MKKTLPIIFFALIISTSAALTGCGSNKPAAGTTNISEDSQVTEASEEEPENEPQNWDENKKETADDKKDENNADKDEKESTEKATSENSIGTGKVSKSIDNSSNNSVNSQADSEEKSTEASKQTSFSPQTANGQNSTNSNTNIHEENSGPLQETNTQSSNLNVVPAAQTDSGLYSGNPLQQTYQVYEEVTMADGDDSQLYTDLHQQETEKAEEYTAAYVECPNSPNNYHSWTSVNEWYNGDQLINTGSEPAGGFTSSEYLYSECDYCGARSN